MQNSRRVEERQTMKARFIENTGLRGRPLRQVQGFIEDTGLERQAVAASSGAWNSDGDGKIRWTGEVVERHHAHPRGPVECVQEQGAAAEYLGAWTPAAEK